MAVALDKFVKQLEDSGIIAPAQLENFIPPKAHPKDADELARELIKHNQLTKFQAQHVLQGKAKALFLGNYTILDKIGAGGMGQVFKAEHRRMHRVVAIKMLPPAMTKDAAALARFEREVTAASKLLHPNIVSAFDADEANGAHFLVMEFVDGKDLSAMVKKSGRFAVDKAVNCILQAARGLEFAHAEGIVHRDIKPANLLLDKKGVVKILDMGLARIDPSAGDVAAQAELTGSGAIMGTVDYMAPEQGVSTKDADARADIYSLGCSLHYLLIAKPIYAGESISAKLLAHHHQPIPDLCQLREDVPEQVNAVFRKMVAKSVADRYQTMTEAVADLQACGVGHDQSFTMQQSMVSTAENSALTFLKNIPGAPTHKPKPTKQASPASPGNGKKELIYGAVSAGLLALAILAAIIVSLRTKDGTLIVEVDQPDAMVQVLDDQGKVEVSQKGVVGKITIGVDPGKHRLKVEKDGFTVFGEAFQMDSGGKKAITAKLVPVKREVVTSTGPVGLPKPLVAPFNAVQAKAGQAAWAKHLGTKVEQKNPVGMTLVLIPPGEYLMGSTDEQVEAALKVAEEIKAEQGTTDRIQKAERPQHKVVITKPFLLGKTEVTIGQFRQFVEATKYVTETERLGGGITGQRDDEGKPVYDPQRSWRTPGYAVTDDSPVAQITWNDAVAFCQWLSTQEKTTYRLPTEAEWEYACRAGTTTQYSFGDDYADLEKFGWYNKKAGGKSYPAGTKLPNAFGLHDMHGNLNEWCGDFYDEKWYEKSSSNDPSGPAASSTYVIRGGGWTSSASVCRSAYRNHGSSSDRGTVGFRCVRVADATADSRLARGGTAPQPNQPWNTPAFQQWMKLVAAMPADNQVDAVAKKLQELNPGFDGKLTGANNAGRPKIENGIVTELKFDPDHVTDISPLRVLSGLKVLVCIGGRGRSGKLADLSPLEGMKLTKLECLNTQVSDLSPLRGMPLVKLGCNESRVSELSPLAGMKLTWLGCRGTRVVDLSPLRGMPLERLECSRTKVSDLSPLEDCKSLRSLSLYATKVTSASIAALQKTLPHCEIEWPEEGQFYGQPMDPAKPNTYLNDPAFRQWMKAVAALPAEKQVEAVVKKLQELNPGFDGGETHKVEQGVVTRFDFFSFNVTDISPLRALVGLKVLNCFGGTEGRGKLSDLSPLQGVPLTFLNCGSTQVSDLTTLQGMPLTTLLCSNTPVSNLSPLQGMSLTRLECGNTQVTDLSPMQGMPLTTLLCYSTKVSDLKPLRGAPLVTLACQGTQVSDVSPLDACKGLTSLDVKGTKVTPAAIAALQKALPNCKIEWDGATNAIAGQQNKSWNTSAFQQWMKTVAALPAEKQVEAVAKKLMELNPGFDGKVTDHDWKGTPKIEKGVVTQIEFAADSVADLSPIRALVGLKRLGCRGSGRGKGKLSELSPLEGMPLTFLVCANTCVTDLSPLKGMRLTKLHCYHTHVSDLSPLQGMQLMELLCNDTLVSDLSPLHEMKLTKLNCAHTPVSDLSPLHGMPLTELNCDQTPVSDLSSLAGMHLTNLAFTPTNIAKGIDAIRQMTSLEAIGLHWDATVPANEFWKKYDAGESGKPITDIHDAAFQAWMKTVAVLPAEKQIVAVVKKLVELNPGFDGKVTGSDGKGAPKIENGVVTEVRMITDNVTDISPLRALAGLKSLSFGIDTDHGRIHDLSPLQGMQLTRLHFSKSQVSDLSPLEGMPLTILTCSSTQVSDLSPLAGMRLTSLLCNSTQVSDLSPLRGMPLKTLWCYGTKASDLSPLQGMSLTEIRITPKNITIGMEVLRQMKSLQSIGVSPKKEETFPAAEFWKKFDAGEFGRPGPSAIPSTE